MIQHLENGWMKKTSGSKKSGWQKKMTNPVRCILLLIIVIDLALYFEDPVR